ncbi:MAG: PDZ domain-containing protein [Bacteroidales bacterium]|jgi:C-terminal processing protease CtpA/Prc|nr:PDZ domain-containing protein [Bacteroidales bacterium]
MRNYSTKTAGYLLLWAILFAVIPSCNKDDDGNPGNRNINGWILDNMSFYYLWNDRIPAGVNTNLSPTAYFESLLYRQEDRFSGIWENFIALQEALSGVVMEAGYDFGLGRFQNSEQVFGFITYVKPNSPAENAGLKRGDHFVSINGYMITEYNYSSLIGYMSSAHTLGIIDQETETVKTVSLQVTKYEENPLLLDTIYQIGDRKVGYFVYNFFARDNGDGSITYEKELNTLFENFKTEGVNELIVDLRYNGGGTVTTSMALASMISKCGNTDVFGVTQYNRMLDAALIAEEGANYNREYFPDNLIRYDEKGDTVEWVPIHQLGMEKVYVITSNRTASASELLINSLKPYMTVVTVGRETYGKNVGSVLIYEKNPEKQKSNTWGMLPIICKFANKLEFSDYGNGFAPDIAANEYDWLNILPLGDTQETLLKATLNHVTGGSTMTGAAVRQPLTHIGSSADRIPARQNAYIRLRKK